MAITRYHAKMKRLRALEPRHTAALRVALIRQAETAAAALEQLAAVPGEAGVAMLAALIQDRWLIAPLQALYVAAGVPEAREEYDYLTGPVKRLAPGNVISDWGGRLKRFITTEGAAAVRGITETTRKKVREVLNKAAAEGMGIQEAARTLRAKVATLAAKRARVIVRTELITAANFGSLLGAQATGLRLEKFWIATPGPRTRPEHQAAHSQGAPLQDGLFVVGGERCRYPGDPMLSAGMRCNCRCAVGYRERG